MNADAAFVTGKTHAVCQDYARAAEEGQYVIVSDGCSGAPDTDFGARLLVKSVENNLSSPSEALISAQAAARVLLLNEYALDATLLLAKYRETNGSPSIQVNTYGDGVVAAITKNGEIEAYHIEYPSGYPQYISYRLNPLRQARLEEIAKDKNRPVVTKWSITKGGFEQIQGDVLDTDNDYNLFFFPFENYSLVALFSDGVTSFTDAERLDVPWQTIVAEMMDFGVARKGKFVLRQMTWLVKEFSKRKWSHHDDITIGAINIAD